MKLKEMYDSELVQAIGRLRATWVYGIWEPVSPTVASEQRRQLAALENECEQRYYAECDEEATVKQNNAPPSS